MQTPDSWPQFRANQAQTGFVPGHLPDRLQLVWRFKSEGPIKSSPVIQGGRVYIGSSDEHVYALDLNSGQQVWAAAVDGPVEAVPAFVVDTVYTATMKGTLYALNALDGQTRWTYTTGDKVAGAVNWFKNAAGGVCILAGSYDARVHCVDAQTGKAVWTYETESYVNGSPAVGADCCAFGGCDAVIRVLSLADGNQVNAIESGSYIAASAAIHDGFVYAGTYDGELLKAPLVGTEVAWLYASDGDPFVASPAVTNAVVVIGSGDGRLHCVDQQTGQMRWTFAALDAVDSSAAICGDKVVVGSQDGRLYLLNLTDGKQLWSYEMGQAITSSPAIAGGMIVVGCDDGMVYAFK